MFTDEEIWDILKILASLLHLGNVTYRATFVDNIDATEVVAVDCLQKTSRLLEVSLDRYLTLLLKMLFSCS